MCSCLLSSDVWSSAEPDRYAIRPPRRDELEALRSIERDAGRAFAALGMAEIAADERGTARSPT
jgi:hypothetical protein